MTVTQMPHPRNVAAVLLLAAGVCFAQEAPATRPAAAQVVARGVCYRPDAANDADRRACLLDVHTPAAGPGQQTVVWFHGGGMTSGKRADNRLIVDVLTAAGINVVSVDYRLSPAAKYPAYVEDAAAAFAWTVRHAADYGFDPKQTFIGGYSAGGYLACAVGTDARWLKAAGLSLADVRGVVALSPQVFTHYAIRHERGVPDWEWKPVIDDAAPVYHAAKDLPPIRLFCGDHDTPTRREEIEYFVSILRHAKNTTTELTVIPGRTHGSIYGEMAKASDPIATGITRFVRARSMPSATQPVTP